MGDDDNQEIKMTLTFEPGCFDAWEGTQEELDMLVAVIKQKFEDGSLFTDSTDLESDEDMITLLSTVPANRTLH